MQTCSFCNMPLNETKLMIAGPDCNICQECVRVCQQLVNTHEFNQKYMEIAKESFAEIWGTDI